VQDIYLLDSYYFSYKLKLNMKYMKKECIFIWGVDIFIFIFVYFRYNCTGA